MLRLYAFVLLEKMISDIKFNSKAYRRVPQKYNLRNTTREDCVSSVEDEKIVPK